MWVIQLLISIITTKLTSGYKTLKSVVFCGLFPLDPADYNNLRDALDKLKLNDASFMFEAEPLKPLVLVFDQVF